MKKKLLLNALVKFISGLMMLSLVLFLPAGTLRFPNAWLLIGLLFIPMLLLGAILYLRAPDLLKKRLNNRESEPEQGMVILLSSLMFAAGFVVAGLDFRFQWSHVSRFVVIAASIVFLLGYAIFCEVLRENAYLSRTVEVQKDQLVVDTGLYGIVRHPMYFGTVLLFWAMPLVLGSYYAFLVFLPYPLLLVSRIKNEEAVLVQGLKGYKEYMQRVKYRLLPFVW